MREASRGPLLEHLKDTSEQLSEAASDATGCCKIPVAAAMPT
jgi:hypothetical protein